MFLPLDLWERVWGCGKDRGTAEDAERELDREDELFWRRRILGIGDLISLI